jgi:hypothetical protein
MSAICSCMADGRIAPECKLLCKELRAAGRVSDTTRTDAGVGEITSVWVDETHTDHPLRHYDHTCPACNARGPIPDYPSRTFQHDGGRRTVPWEDWQEMRRIALALKRERDALHLQVESLKADKAGSA